MAKSERTRCNKLRNPLHESFRGVRQLADDEESRSASFIGFSARFVPRSAVSRKGEAGRGESDRSDPGGDSAKD
jgi:hypothetical protein